MNQARAANKNGCCTGAAHLLDESILLQESINFPWTWRVKIISHMHPCNRRHRNFESLKHTKLTFCGIWKCIFYNWIWNMRTSKNASINENSEIWVGEVNSIRIIFLLHWLAKDRNCFNFGLEKPQIWQFFDTVVFFWKKNSELLFVGFLCTWWSGQITTNLLRICLMNL